MDSCWTGFLKFIKKDFIIKNKNFLKFKRNSNNDEIYFPHSKLIKIYKSHDAYINLARIESFGITLLGLSQQDFQ